MARQQPENKIVQKIKTQLETEYGGLWFKVHGGAYQQNGISDLLGCVEGHFIALEVKVPGRESSLTELQSKFLEDTRKAGGCAAMVTSVDQARDLMREWSEEWELL